eukprot:317534-Ditylum_brightwellii.AAC.1
MMHTTTQTNHKQLVFGRDAILNAKHEEKWKYINERKENMIKKNNGQENKKRKKHIYQVVDRVLIKGDRSTKYGDSAYHGPYKIVNVNSNSTIRINEYSAWHLAVDVDWPPMIENYPLLFGSGEEPNFPRFGRDLYDSLGVFAEEV